MFSMPLKYAPHRGMIGGVKLFVFFTFVYQWFCTMKLLEKNIFFGHTSSSSKMSNLSLELLKTEIKFTTMKLKE